jgi:hypothetical protein
MIGVYLEDPFCVEGKLVSFQDGRTVTGIYLGMYFEGGVGLPKGCQQFQAFVPGAVVDEYYFIRLAGGIEDGLPVLQEGDEACFFIINGYDDGQY